MGQLRRRSVLTAIDRLFRVGTAGGLSDAQLMERFATRHGEAAEAAFAALIERHGPMVLRVCRRVLNDPHDAQDAFQATFLILVQRPGAVRQRASLAGWLYGVALRVAAHSRAASARRRVVEQAAGSKLTSGCVPEEDRHEIWEEVDRLPERFRVAVVLCYLEGLTHEQAAARLGWPVGTVRSRLARARERLRGRLVKRGLAPGGAVLAGLVSSAKANGLPLALIEHTIKAAMLIAAHDAAEAGLVSASAAALTQGVLRKMFCAKLKWVALALMTAGTVAAGTGVYAYQAPRPTPRPAPVVAGGVADDSKAPVAEPVVSEGSENPEREPTLTADPKGKDDDHPASPEELALFVEIMAELTRAARVAQEEEKFAEAAEFVGEIKKLASRWGSMLITTARAKPPAPSPFQPSTVRTGKSIARPPRPPVPPLAPANTTRPLTTPAPAPASDADRRLAELEQKLERLVRVLGDQVPGVRERWKGNENEPQSDLAFPIPRTTPTPRDFSPLGTFAIPTEPRDGPPPPMAIPTEPRRNKAMPLFKKKKAPVYTYPKRTEDEAEQGESPEPAAPPLPPAGPLPPEPPKPSTNPNGQS
jgi:RNA polymerase sigma factor (sigma-70 family)